MLFKKMFSGLLIVVLIAGCKIELSTPAEELKATIESNINGMNDENIDASLEAVHTQSPFYDQMQVMLSEIAKVYDLESSLVSFEYLGMDKAKSKAVVLVRQKTVKLSGPDFRDNIVDTMTVFKKDGDVWKIWQSLTLDVEYLN